MKKSAHTLLLPETPQELLDAIDKTQEISDRVKHFAGRIDGMPASKEAAKAVLATLEAELAKKETELMLADESAVAGLQTEIEVLLSQVSAKQGEITRSGLHLRHMNDAGEALYTELATAQTDLRTESGIHARALQDVLADKIVETAEALAEYSAAYRELAVTAGFSLDWFTLSHISDPRQACSITVGQHTYDRAPNLLASVSSDTAGHVKATKTAISSVKRAEKLAREHLFQPLVEKQPSQWEGRSYVIAGRA